ncbi:hypothetical protein [Rathayibacter toxicus]|uniref:Uncharacterized protein n=1 Tax=Rathayibacter toxicus TaxID=145458 RepID=A0A2S5Y804_9MICO|nr:hypothetical protein [Rathayibacter toxicus]PPH24450.1 hypothetical protein C5D17_04020 [Rathayibacter toxicus]PPH57947.1 hypothetical protein C5D30_04050 [Rathayibacter toxicus]PPH88116.1 hypothetical protein C5D31_04040 [Rathayibacter toxicus]PPI15775.1 hypothetical protein C5C51_04030 [Rathayibacter toxicus]QWL32677.1 hypothetical protein E2R35_07520 [Rathayibacter toxicus]
MSHFNLSTPVIALAITAVVSTFIVTTVRFVDKRRNPHRLAAYNRAPGALFVVKNRQWQAWFLRIGGIVTSAVSGLLFLSGLAMPKMMLSAGFLVWTVVLMLVGPSLIILSVGVKRARVDVFVDRLIVRPWFKEERTISLDEIGFIVPSVNNLGGIDVKDTRRKMLFTATRVSIGYDDIVSFLRERTPRQWDEFIKKYRGNDPVILREANAQQLF